MQRSIARLAALLASLLTSSALPAAEDAITFPIPFYKEVLIVPVVFDGEEHLFVLDSGASTHVFHSTFSDRLGTPLSDPITSENHGEPFEHQQYITPEAKIGSMPLPRNTPVSCADLSTVRASLGRDIAGILGIPLFVECVIQLDFDRREIRLLPGATQPSAEWGEPVDVRFTNSKLPHVSARFASYENEMCVIDTGAGHSLALREEVYRFLQGRGAISSLPSTKVATIARIAEAQQGVLNEFELGSRVHRSLRITERGSRSLIGLDYLRRYLVTFDLGNGKIYLQPGFDFDRPDDVRRLGLSLLRHDDSTVVESVGDDSLALDAGLHVGDKLLTVAGQDVAGKPIAEIGWILQSQSPNGKSKPLNIERNGKRHMLLLKQM